MPSSGNPVDVLERVLLLEQDHAYRDRAVMGGLAAFACRQMELSTNDADRKRALRVASLLEGYGGADREERAQAVLRSLQTLNGEAGTDVGITNLPVAVPARPLPSTTDRALPGVAPKEEGAGRNVAKPTSRGIEALDEPVGGVKGVGKKFVEILEHVGVFTIRDLLFYFPRTHYDYTDTRSISRMRLGEKITLVGTIKDIRNNRTRRGIVITTATIADDTGTVAVRWFNQPFLMKNLSLGARIAVTGEPDVFNGYFTFNPRDYELIRDVELTHAARLVPVYPLTKGLYQKALRQLIRTALANYVGSIADFLPGHLREKLDLPALSEALEQYHFPQDEARRARAERRLAFDELLMVQVGLLIRKQEWQQTLPEVAVPLDQELLTRFSTSLSFSLTHAQEKVIFEILRDMARPVPMSRLLQGDVGSGKTVVAAAALLQTARAGKQGVLMAPTEILAEQHYRTMDALLKPYDINSHLLIGSTPKAKRAEVYGAVLDGSADVVIGTHALIQEDLRFVNLGLAITDEQHRFGVDQRATLRQKGEHPHILAMSATPIPRTLAMTIYGDLDVSALDEMPPGRIPAITRWVRTPVEAYRVVREQVQQGRQAFVICPVIEESMDTDMRSVMAEHRELQKLTFPDLEVALLHGRMKASEKEAILGRFRRGEIHLLVATSVIEVGIDVPNATVVVIRDAHRFGLAQLHQFRGRVGRGGDQAYCILLSPTESDDARERLEALASTENGFELAEQDLRSRGPGEFWSTRQSGLPELKVAQLGDLATIKLARGVAEEILADDPKLVQPGHQGLQKEVQRFWNESADLS